ncbi:MAG: 50S ribosomal protein L10 [Gammaproteobacteria bacterium]|nr:50S ribosomal protein L10 [Gammaproteobacteria bacterium]
MSLSIDQKKAVVSEVSEALASARAGVLAEYRGLSVAQLTDLRVQARRRGVWVRVIKNSLARRIITGSDFECLSEHFTGPVILSASEDPVAVAGVAADFAKENEHFKITAGVMNGELIDLRMIGNLAKLPGRDELIAQLIGAMRAPLQNLVATLNEVPARLVRTVSAIAQSKDAG